MLPARSQILMPVRASTIMGSFALALFLNFLPWPDMRVVPDFVALVLAFWCVRQPRLVGIGIGWMIGLVADAGNGVLLGQHALAYSLLAFPPSGCRAASSGSAPRYKRCTWRCCCSFARALRCWCASPRVIRSRAGRSWSGRSSGRYCGRR